MERSNRNGRSWRVAALAGLALGVGGLGACSGSGEKSLLGSRTEVLQPGDFAAEVPAGEHVKLPKPVTPIEAPKQAPVTVVNIGGPVRAASTEGNAGLGSIRTVTDVAAAPGTVLPGRGPGTPSSPELVTTVGEPRSTGTPSPASRGTVVEAVVGQVNGRPVFATDVLEPLDGRLRAMADDARDASEWRATAGKAIVKELKRQIDSELILSEAKSSLTPEQKQGLLHFVQTIQSDLVSRNAGSEVKADEELKQRTGRSLRKEAEDSRDQALIKNEINLKVTPLVVVSWRDVQNEYERRQAKYNPPAEYHFRMMYADASNEAAVKKLQGMLDSGTPFVDVAGDSANEYDSVEKGLVPVKKQNEAVFHPAPELNKAFKEASVGRVVGPITYAPNASRPEQKRVAWVYLEKIDQPKTVSLYDAQLDIEEELRQERFSVEIERYFDRLYKRANVSNFEQMADRLLQIATDRYAPKYSTAPRAG